MKLISLGFVPNHLGEADHDIRKEQTGEGIEEIFPGRRGADELSLRSLRCSGG